MRCVHSRINPQSWSRRPAGRPSTMSLSAVTAAVTLAGAMLVVQSAPAQAAGGLRPPAPRTAPVPVSVVSQVPPATTAMPDFKASVSWPAAGSVVADLTAGTTPASPSALASGQPASTAVWAGHLPVSVGRVPVGRAGGAQGSSPTRVGVSMAPHAVATSAGVDGAIVSVSRADGGTGAGQVAVTVDYSSFAQAYGGDYASRLRLVTLPECALTTPDLAGCQTQTPVASSSNDTAAGTVSAVVTLSGTQAVVMAVDSSSGGGGGDFTATSLKPSGSWTAGGSAGAFTYDYSLITPAVPGNLTPELRLSYDSQQVDGYTSATNNQPSWLGDGWTYTPGFVERSYPACLDVAPTADQTGDFCWSDPDNTVTVSLGGMSGTLVHDPSTGWHLKNDNGYKVTLSTGAANGDNNSLAPGEYWVITATNGTRYYFGMNQLPGFVSGNPTTNSVDTEPVFSTASGQPCYNATFKSSYCSTMAYRWNLDYVVDTHGDAIAYYYNRETNSYGADKGAETLSYTRGGYLTKVTYGFRAGQAYSTSPSPAAQVLFTVNGRCNTSSTGCATSTLTSSTASSWPDVPYDVNCSSSCTASKYWAPTFWSEYELTKVQTQVLVGTAYKPADQYTMTYSFPSTGDSSSPALWLASITRQGQDAASSSGYLTLPAVTFQGSALANRVNLADGYDPLTRHRLSKITTETGEVITVAYSGPGCTGSTMPQPDSDTMLCYPQYWTPTGVAQPMLDWFNKYVVESVSEQDTTGGGPVVSTTYNYLGNPAWHYDENPLAKKKYRTWDQWRGYGKVQTMVGTAPDPVTQKQDTFFRGMDSDRTSSGGTTSVTVSDSRGETATDSDWLAGMTRESITYNGVNGPVVSDEITDPWAQQTAAQSRSATGLPTLYAYQVSTAGTRTYVPLAAGGTRESQTTYTRDPHGRATQTSTRPDVSNHALDTCVTESYADNTDAWILNLTAKTTTTAVACGTTPSYPAQMVSQTLNFFDGSTTNGARPTVGNSTMVQQAVAVDSTGAQTTTDTTRHTVDAYGRTLTSTDGNGKVTTTAYTPATGAAPTTTTVTDPLGHRTVTVNDPLIEQPTSVTDAAGYVTTATYDALGRRTAVWKPGEPTSGPASMKYAYAISSTGMSLVSTSTLGPQGTYRVSEKLYDALLREREVQQATLDGGRNITLTWYDSTGQKIKTTAAFYTTGAPDNKLVSVLDGAVPSETGYVYDGAGRQTRQIAYHVANETWETDTSYQGADRMSETPPAGGTPRVTLDDALGRTAQLQQFDSATPSGTSATTTSYTYTPSGKITTTTDSAGNTSTYTYDLLGHLIGQSDPNGGVVTSTYDANGNMTATTDARGKTTTYQYDADNRKTAAYDTTGGVAPSSSNQVASWVYDTKKVGYLTSSTSYQNGLAFTVTTLGYNGFAEPSADQVSIPSGTITGALAGNYVRTFSYDTYIGLKLTETDQAAGGLAQETVDYGYDGYGRPVNVTGTDSYVNKLSYTEFDQPSQYTFGTSGSFTQLTLGYDPQTEALDTALTTTSSASVPLDNTTYRYNNAQEVTQIDDSQGETGANVVNDQCYTYNHLSQLTTAWTAAGNGATACNTAPTAANAATTVGGYLPYWQSWTFDGGGNRSSQTTHDVKGNTGADVAATYRYPAPGSATDQPNTLSTLTSTVGGTVNETSYRYDLAGDTTSIQSSSGSQTLQWDDQGRLASDTTASGTTGYVYNADGSLLLRQDPAAGKLPASTTLLLPDEQLVLSGGTVTGTRYYRLGTTVVAARTATASAKYLVPDRQGSDLLQVDATTLAATRETYTPYGALRTAAPAGWIGSSGYVGGTADPATGLVNLGAREYDPDTGRFLSLDPVMEGSSPQQMNGYAYAGNNPVTRSDPTGLCTGYCQYVPAYVFGVASNQFTNVYVPVFFRQPDYVVYEFDFTLNQAIPPVKTWTAPAVSFFKAPTRTPIVPRAVASMLGSLYGCTAFAGGTGGCVPTLSPTTKERPGVSSTQYWAQVGPWKQMTMLDLKSVPATVAISLIFARNGHRYLSVGVGSSVPWAKESGGEATHSVRLGWFADPKASTFTSKQIDDYMVGNYVAFSGTYYRPGLPYLGPNLVGISASVTKNLPGGWAYELGGQYPPALWSIGVQVGNTWKLP